MQRSVTIGPGRRAYTQIHNYTLMKNSQARVKYLRAVCRMHIAYSYTVTREVGN